MHTANLTELTTIRHFFQGIQRLTIDSVLGDLPSFDVVVDQGTVGRNLNEIFEKDRNLPSVLVMNGEHLRGVISREMFYYNNGKLFGTEIYLGRPIQVMLETIPHTPLILPRSLLIILATQKALDRQVESIYEPIVVEQEANRYRLLSALMLFIAQSQQLIELHRQRLYTVNAGQQLTDRDAIIRFVQHVGNRPEFNLQMFIKRLAVRCDHCSQTVHFSIADIVRTFPQLNRGVIVEEQMGSRMYRLYVRHDCLDNEIWEIPLHLDERLEYRSQRSARAVEYA